jgi:hypothetical protein
MNKSVILKLEGGLGNQLFEFAAGYLLASKLQTSLILDQYGIPLTNHMRESGLGFSEYNWPLIGGKFQITTLEKTMSMKSVNLSKRFRLYEKTILKYRMHQSNLYGLPIYRETESDSDYFAIDHPVKLHGNFQSWKIVEEAVNYGFPTVFSLKEKSKWVNQSLKNIDTQNSLAIHFRLGQDSVSNVEFSQPGTDYYQKAIELLSFNARSKDIYVFSDEIDLAKEKFSHILGKNCHFVEPPISETAAQKQYLISRFGSLICANSTFCSWAGWSISNTGGRVVVPFPFSDSAKKGSRDFPSNWVKLFKSNGENFLN